MTAISMIISECMNYGKKLSETKKTITYQSRNGLRVVISKRRK